MTHCLPARPSTYGPGDIAQAIVRFNDGTGQKPRPVLIIEIVGVEVLIRPIFTKPSPGSACLQATFANGLDHDSHLASWTVRIPRRAVLYRRGELAIDLDPFADFGVAA